MDELWLPIPDCPGYEVSDQGNVQSLDRLVQSRNRWGAFTKSIKGTLLIPQIIKANGGRPYRWFRIAGKYRKAADLVLTAHRGPRPPGQLARHLDDDSFHDALDNLAWGTHAENAADATRNGRRKPPLRGEVAPQALLTESAVLEIRRTYAAGGVLQNELAKKYGVSRRAIGKVIARQTWAHI